jgi:hypothetical protein
MNAAEFGVKLQQLMYEANAAEISIDDLYLAVHGQSLLLETLLKLEIEQAYKERFK